MKGKVICIQLHDGRIVLAIVIHRNGNTLTVRTSGGYLHETSCDAQDSYGVYHVA